MASTQRKKGWNGYKRADWSDFHHTGPDTLAGRYLRMFWQPVLHCEELTTGCARPIKIMNGDYTLYRGEAGAVHLHIADEGMLAAAYQSVMQGDGGAETAKSCYGLLVQEMLDLTNAVEVIVGVNIDPTYGPAILFGMGGIFAEVLTDVALRVAPLTEADAWSMLTEIRGAEVLTGARGTRPVDRGAIVKILLRLNDMAMELPARLREVEVNPLVVFPEGLGAVAADALIVTHS